MESLQTAEPLNICHPQISRTWNRGGDLNLPPGRLGREGRGLGRSEHLEVKTWAEFLPCPHLPTKPSNRLPGVTQAGLSF